MKKRLIALLAVLLLLPLARISAASGTGAESRMEADKVCIALGQSLTVTSHVTVADRGGYCQAVYAVDLKGGESAAELNKLALELVKSGAEPVDGGGKHCYHGGGYSLDLDYPFTADTFGVGEYLFVCYAFDCTGGSYNHDLTPSYDAISTLAVEVVAQSRVQTPEYCLVDDSGREIAVFEGGETVTLDLNSGNARLEVRLGESATERIVAIEASYPQPYERLPFAFDPETMALTTAACGTGTIEVTFLPYADGAEARTEVITLELPCAPRQELMTLEEPTCTEEGLACQICHGYGANCETRFDEVVVPATGHRVGEITLVLEKPTATRPGVATGACMNCGLIGVETEVPPVFSDVAADSFYSDALDYCYAAGWVRGTGDTTFSPGGICQRSAVVTFLWRAAGSPEPVGAENPFVDVKPGDFFYDAVLWAVENGITNGTDSTHFSPYAQCSRAQVVTFLHRAFGSPEAEQQQMPFVDVPSGGWYEQPVLWAVENGITSGISPDRFGPDALCNRAQIVTFLYRAYA